MALVAFIVPFMFAYDQSLLLIGPLSKVALSVVTAVIGVFCLCIGIEGYFRRTLAVWERAVAFIVALLLIAPGYINTGIGAVLIAVLVFAQWRGKKQVVAAGN
jgi:TRAP-type uncharacterized transport system fused permease subunit